MYKNLGDERTALFSEIEDDVLRSLQQTLQIQLLKLPKVYSFSFFLLVSQGHCRSCLTISDFWNEPII